MKIGQPNFKRHGRYNSITYPQYGSFCIKEQKLKLAFVDGLIKLKLHRPFVAEKIKTCTIVRDIDRWFACFSSCNDDIQKSSSSDIVGVDVGLLNWLMLSNGEIIDRRSVRGTEGTERLLIIYLQTKYNALLAIPGEIGFTDLT